VPLPAIVSAVLPNVSLKIPLPWFVMVLPFVSAMEPLPLWVLNGALIRLPFQQTSRCGTAGNRRLVTGAFSCWPPRGIRKPLSKLANGGKVIVMVMFVPEYEGGITDKLAG
jgi:hypothetical protein